MSEMKMPVEEKKKFRKPSRKKVCAFCLDKSSTIDYKDVNKLRKYITEKGKNDGNVPHSRKCFGAVGTGSQKNPGGKGPGNTVG